MFDKKHSLTIFVNTTSPLFLIISISGKLGKTVEGLRYFLFDEKQTKKFCRAVNTTSFRDHNLKTTPLAVLPLSPNF